MTDKKETIRPRATDAQIMAIKPATTRRYISDELVPNLYLVIEPSGTRSWRFDAKMGAGRVKMTLGRYPAFGLAEAREWARDRNAERDRGDDPRRLARQREEAANTLNDRTVRKVWEEWVAMKRRTGQALRSLYNYEQLVRKDVLPLHGDKPITALTSTTIETIRDTMQDRGAAGSANRLLTLLQQFLAWARKRKYVEEVATAGVERLTLPPSSERVLSVKECARLYLAAEHLDPDDRDVTRLLVLTACRLNEVAMANVCEYRDGVFTVPGQRSKSGNPHPLVLPPLSKAIFESRLNIRENGFLFADAPGKYSFKHLNPAARAVLNAVTDSTVEHWTIHDIRGGVRTGLCSDEMDEMGEVFSEDIAEIVLNHARPKLNKTYNKARYQRQIGRALDAWERLIRQEMAKLTGDNVIKLAA